MKNLLKTWHELYVKDKAGDNHFRNIKNLLKTWNVLDIEAVSDEIIKSVVEGYESALDAKCLSSVLRAIAERIDKDKDVNDIAIRESIGQPTYKGVKVHIREVGVRYDFSNSPTWCVAKEAEQIVATRRKKIEELCKKVTGMTIFTNTDDGEQFELAPAIRYGKEQVVITL